MSKVKSFKMFGSKAKNHDETWQNLIKSIYSSILLNETLTSGSHDDIINWTVMISLNVAFKEMSDSNQGLN